MYAQGVVSPDRSRAIFSIAQLESAYPDPAGPVRFRGRRDDAVHRVRPVFHGLSTSGLHAPVWWGPGTCAGEPVPEFAFRHRRFPEPHFPGGTFLGATLRTVGLASPRVHPDQVTIYLVDEV